MERRVLRFVRPECFTLLGRSASICFISAGHGSWYSGTLHLLKEGDRVCAKAPGCGFVAVGVVTGESVPAGSFSFRTEGHPVPALDVLTEGYYCRDEVDDPETCEYFVPVRWIDTVPLNRAVNKVGLFGNQNTVCAPKNGEMAPHYRAAENGFPGLEPGGRE